VPGSCRARPVVMGGCSGWSYVRARGVRQLDGSSLVVRPRRARCPSCSRTQVLLPGSCQPRRADATEVIGNALLAKALGRGYRRIAVDLARPPSTVRRWLRAARGNHRDWLRRRGVKEDFPHCLIMATARLIGPEVLLHDDRNPQHAYLQLSNGDKRMATNNWNRPSPRCWERLGR
jgi:hypothetical protein